MVASFQEELIPLNARRRKIPSHNHLPAKTIAPPPIPPGTRPDLDTGNSRGARPSPIVDGNRHSYDNLPEREGEPKRLGRPIGTIDEDPDLDLAEEPQSEEETEDGYDETSARLVPDKKDLKNAPLLRPERLPVFTSQVLARVVRE